MPSPQRLTQLAEVTGPLEPVSPDQVDGPAVRRHSGGAVRHLTSGAEANEEGAAPVGHDRCELRISRRALILQHVNQP